MTLIIGTRCQDGVVISADRKLVSRDEIGPDITKLYKLPYNTLLAGAGDNAVLNEARVFIDRKIQENAGKIEVPAIFDIVEIVSNTVNDLVGYYQSRVEEPFGYVVAGLDNGSSGEATIYTIFGAGFTEVPWVCVGSGRKYARPLLDLMLADGERTSEETVKVLSMIFAMVGRVHTCVSDQFDYCIVNDERGAGEIMRGDKALLKPVKSAIIRTLKETLADRIVQSLQQ